MGQGVREHGGEAVEERAGTTLLRPFSGKGAEMGEAFHAGSHISLFTCR